MMEAAYAAHYARFVDVVGSQVSQAWVLPPGDQLGEQYPGGDVKLLIKRSQKDGGANKGRSVLQHMNYKLSTGQFTPSFPIQLDASVVSITPSPSGTFLAVLRKEADGGGVLDAGAGSPKKFSLELWSMRGSCLRSLPSNNLHGDVLADGWFSDGMVWSPDSRYCVYVAERKATGIDLKGIAESVRGTVSSAVLGQPSPIKGNTDGDPSALSSLQAGAQFDYSASAREDWGEKYTGVRSPGLFLVDWHTGVVLPVGGIPEDVAAGQPAWLPATDGEGEGPGPWLVYTGWSAGIGRRLGMIYCYNRPCKLYAVSLSATLAAVEERAMRAFEIRSSGVADKGDPVHHCLTPLEPASRSPRPSPSGASIAYLSMSGVSLKTHNGGSALRMFDWRAWNGLRASMIMSDTPPPPLTTPQIYVPGPMTVLGALQGGMLTPPHSARAALSPVTGPGVGAAAVDSYLELPPAAAGAVSTPIAGVGEDTPTPSRAVSRSLFSSAALLLIPPATSSQYCAAAEDPPDSNGMVTKAVSVSTFSRVVVDTVQWPAWPADAPASITAAPVLLPPSSPSALVPSWFPGFYAHSLPTSAWAADESTLLVNSHKGSACTVYGVDVRSGRVSEPFEGPAAREGGSLSLHCVLALPPPWASSMGPASASPGRGGAGEEEGVPVRVSGSDAPAGPVSVPVLALCVYSSPSSPDSLVMQEGTVWRNCNGKVEEEAALEWGSSSMEGPPDAYPPTQAGPPPFTPSLGPVPSTRISGPGGTLLPAPFMTLPHATARVLQDCAGIDWHVLPVYPRLKAGSSKALDGTLDRSVESPFEAILLRPKASGEGSRPLVLAPHGGPHAAFTTNFLLPYAYLASLGYVVLLVNYRGSTGFGEGSLACLPGKCGDIDVDDCYTALLVAAAAGGVQAASSALFISADSRNVAVASSLASVTGDTLRIDPTRLVVAGGSHGGFLALHLMAYPSRLAAASSSSTPRGGVEGPSSSVQTSGAGALPPPAAPLRFAAAVIRNPVTNILTMAGSTDIPDWCWTEALGLDAWAREGGVHPVLAPDVRAAAMLQRSPMAWFEAIATSLPGVQTAAAAGFKGVGVSAGKGASSPRPLPPFPVDLALEPVSGGSAMMLMLGLKDRRVPPSQGFELYHALKARLACAEEGMKALVGASAVPAGASASTLFTWRSLRLLTFPEDVHALDRPATEGEAWPAIAAWLHAVLRL